jgi:hypothetical protein
MGGKDEAAYISSFKLHVTGAMVFLAIQSTDMMLLMRWLLHACMHVVRLPVRSTAWKHWQSDLLVLQVI